MKTLTLTLAAVAVLSLTGCTSKQEAISMKAASIEDRNMLNDLPSWYQNPNSLGDVYAAAGYAKPNKANDIELQRIEAAATARAELARQMDLDVRDMFKRASQELGTDDSQVMDNAVQYATKQVAHVTLKNSKQKKIFLDRDTKLMYVLFVLDENLTNAQIKEAVTSSLKNNDATWQKFQATQVWQELDKETVSKTSNTN